MLLIFLHLNVTECHDHYAFTVVDITESLLLRDCFVVNVHFYADGCPLKEGVRPQESFSEACMNFPGHFRALRSLHATKIQLRRITKRQVMNCQKISKNQGIDYF